MKPKMNRNLEEILEPLGIYHKKVDDEIIKRLTTGIQNLDDGAKHLFLNGGKKIRASLVILSGGLKGDIPDGIVELAAAVEIVHAGTLIHDDIIDQSLLRRGDITVSRKYGNKVAVLAGDYMYTLGLDIALKDDNPELFPIMVSGTSDMVKGELYQMQYSNIDSIKKEHYYNIIDLKTAVFMASCVKMGAVKAGFNNSECDELYEFGHNIGFAFQIIDDTLDFIDNSTTGKDTGNDFLDGKITLPLLYLIEKSKPEDRLNLLDIFKNPDYEGWYKVRELARKSGAIDDSINEAKGYVENALGIINKYPDSEFRKILIDLAEFLVNRDF